MRESIFNTEIVNSLKATGAFAHKIADLPASKSRGLIFTPTKPFDIFGCYKGVFFAVESKQFKEWKGFGISALRDNQIEALDNVVKTGGKAFVFINIRIVRTENRLIAFDWALWGEVVKAQAIGVKDMRTMPYIQGRKDLFDLAEFMEELCQKT